MPITAHEFDYLMTPLGPFERAPDIAVAVSGGADSMALALLADDWVRRRAGRMTALIVDHGLRGGSTDEAAQVAAWLAARDVAAVVLTWAGPKPTADIQARARAARYRLLGEWCRGAGVLHLLLAHHRDDQAETVLLRLERHSGPDGLAAMAAVVETAEARYLRPLLGAPKARLYATLEAFGQPWVEDPSNRDAAFARGRLRASMPALADQGVTAERLSGLAAAMGRARGIVDSAVAALLADAVAPHPAGFCRLDPARYAGAPAEIARRALARIVQCVGGGVYTPRSDRLERLRGALAAGCLRHGRTLGGCRVLQRRDGILICREPAAAAEESPLEAGGSVRWDGRFTLRATAASGHFMVRKLGRDGWRAAVARQPALRKTAIPPAVRPALPAVYDLDGLVAVPHLRFMRDASPVGGAPLFETAFRPAQALGPPGFAFVGPRG
ncbi:MAG: tRNA lysidine(34) synthetase TilS [Alphaproteobacteria bacterium]